ncbi:MAG: ROK family protein [Candidatus Syntrophosphaera sp.]
MTTKEYSLGLDIGASSVKYGWGNCQQGLQLFDKKPIQHKSLSCLKDTIIEILDVTDQKVGLQNILSIGIGTPGTIDRDTGKIVGVNPNMPYWIGHKPDELIPSGIQAPIYYDNDANLMALAEAWLRGSQGKLIGVTIGSGIGCGFVDNGSIYKGSHGFAMELGHMTVYPGGELCSCGRKGCLEAYTSVEGLRYRIGKTRENICESILKSDLSSFIQRKKDNQNIQRIIEEGMKALTIGLANAIILFDPDIVVLGGGAMDAGLYDIQELYELLQKMLPKANACKLKLEMALEGNRAGVLGAIILAS